MRESKVLGLSLTKLTFLLFAAAIIVYPLIWTGGFAIGAGINVGAMAVGALGFVLLIGYAHQLALGQAGFSLIGGYCSAILTVRYGWDPFSALLVALALSMTAAYFIGLPILKLRGFILAMASLAFQLILVYIALEAGAFTGGAEGIPGVPKFGVFGVTFSTDLAFFYFTWLLVILSIVLGLNIDRSRIGRSLKAIAASEAAAGSVGIDITIYKVQMFVLSAGLASIAGSLMVHYLRIMTPNIFGFVFALTLITSVIIGGLASIWGGMIGAVVVVVLRENLREFEIPLWEVVIMGALTVIVLILFQRGIAGFIGDLVSRIIPPPPNLNDSATDPIVAEPFYNISSSGGTGALLKVDGAQKNFGSLQAVDNVSCEIQPNMISALIGPNGAGKTTLFNLITGHLPLNSGQIIFDGVEIDKMLPHQIASIGVGRTFQNLQLFDNMTVIENVMCGYHRLAKAGLATVSLGLPNVVAEERKIRDIAVQHLAFVGLADATEQSPSALPFGHQRLLEIARALAGEPKILLMDEPASGLNESETEQLAELILRIRELGTTVLLVEHEIRLVMGLAEHIIVMNHGSKIAEGPVAEIRADPEVIAAYLGTG